MKDLFIADQIGNERLAGKLSSFQDRWVNTQGWQKTAGFPEVGRFGNMLAVKGKKIYILDSPLSKNLQVKAHADILLINRNSGFSIKQLKNIFSPLIILNVSSASHSRIISWSDQARIMGLRFYDLKSTGFYQEEL